MNIRPILTLILLSFSSLNVASAQADPQQTGPSLGCVDPAIRQKSETIKKHYTDQGFTVYRDAMLGMDSQTPYPIVVQMVQGCLYEIVFIGNEESKNMHLDLYDEQDQVIDKRQVMRNRDQPNYMIYTFTPQRTQEFLVVVSQKLKSRSMCGSFCILKYDPTKGKREIIPYSDHL